MYYFSPKSTFFQMPSGLFYVMIFSEGVFHLASKFHVINELI